MSTETAEEFQPLSTADNPALDAMITRGPRTFHGVKLAPYSITAEGLIREAGVGIRGDELFALTFLRVLADLQSGYDRYRADGWDGGKARAMSEDAAAEASEADLFSQLYTNLASFRAKANGWRRNLGRKGVEEAVALVNEITKEAKDTEVIAADAEPAAPGK